MAQLFKQGSNVVYKNNDGAVGQVVDPDKLFQQYGFGMNDLQEFQPDSNVSRSTANLSSQQLIDRGLIQSDPLVSQYIKQNFTPDQSAVNQFNQLVDTTNQGFLNEYKGKNIAFNNNGQTSFFTVGDQGVQQLSPELFRTAEAQQSAISLSQAGGLAPVGQSSFQTADAFRFFRNQGQAAQDTNNFGQGQTINDSQYTGRTAGKTSGGDQLYELKDGTVTAKPPSNTSILTGESNGNPETGGQTLGVQVPSVLTASVQAPETKKLAQEAINQAKRNEDILVPNVQRLNELAAQGLTEKDLIRRDGKIYIRSDSLFAQTAPPREVIESVPEQQLGRQISNPQELNALANQGLTEKDIIRKDGQIFLNPDSEFAQNMKPIETLQQAPQQQAGQDLTPQEQQADQQSGGVVSTLKNALNNLVSKFTGGTNQATGEVDELGTIQQQIADRTNFYESEAEKIKSQTIPQAQIDRQLSNLSVQAAEELKDLRVQEEIVAGNIERAQEVNRQQLADILSLSQFQLDLAREERAIDQELYDRAQDQLALEADLALKGYIKVPDSFTGDTIQIGGRKYLVPSGVEDMDTKIVDVGGRQVLLDMQTGQVIQDLGLSSSSGDTPSASQYTAGTFAVRSEDSNNIITNFENNFGQQKGIQGILPQFLKGEDQKNYEQAKRNFVNAILRKESGAVISDEEFDNASKQYFAQPGDNESELKQKQKNRQTAVLGLKLEAGDVYDALRSQIDSTPGSDGIDSYIDSLGFNSDLGKSQNYLSSYGEVTGFGSPYWKWGLDVDLQKGDPVKSPVNGKVVFVGENGGFGNQIKVQDENGNEWWLSHLDTTAVKKGQQIRQGQLLASGGNTGSVIPIGGGDGSHLDITVKKKDGSYADPRDIYNSLV